MLCSHLNLPPGGHHHVRFMSEAIRENYDQQVCEEGLHKLWPQPYHRRPQVKGDVDEVTMSQVCPHSSVNHMVFFLYHAFIIFVYINNIWLCKQHFNFLYCVCTTFWWFKHEDFHWIFRVGLNMKTPWTILHVIWFTQKNNTRSMKLSWWTSSYSPMIRTSAMFNACMANQCWKWLLPSPWVQDANVQDGHTMLSYGFHGVSVDRNPAQYIRIMWNLTFQN